MTRLIVTINICWLMISSLNAQNPSDPHTISDIITPYTFRVNFIASDSGKIAYVDEGSGEKTLLFIHGLATYLPSWDKLIDALKSRYRCVAIDLPGYGRSYKGGHPLTMSYHATVIDRVVKALGLKNVVLCGHSMGAQIAITYALQHPEYGNKLILLAPAGIETFTASDRQWFQSFFTAQAVGAATEQQIRFNYGLNFFHLPADSEFMIRDRLAMRGAADFDTYCNTVAGNVQAMLSEPVFDQLGSIRQKTLVVYGENDMLIPNQLLHKNLSTKDIAETAARQIPDSRLVMLPECGHMVPFEKPIKLSNIIDEFLKE